MLNRKKTIAANSDLDSEIQLVLVWGTGSITKRSLNTHIFYAPEAGAEGQVITPKLAVMVRTGLLTEFPTTSWNPNEFQTAYCDIVPTVELYSASNGFNKPRIVVFAIPREIKGDTAGVRYINDTSTTFAEGLDIFWSLGKEAVFIPRVLPKPDGLQITSPALSVGSSEVEPEAHERYAKRGREFKTELDLAWSSAEQIIKSLKGRQRYEATYGKLARSLYVY